MYSPALSLARLFVVSGAAVLLLLAGCATHAPVSTDAQTQPLQCSAPRPQICTMDYRPVCARLTSGERVTYANGCGACADARVVSHQEGECD